MKKHGKIWEVGYFDTDDGRILCLMVVIVTAGQHRRFRKYRASWDAKPDDITQCIVNEHDLSTWSYQAAWTLPPINRYEHQGDFLV